MALEPRLAWRNVWRNPRRSALTIAATVFAVVLVLLSVAMAAGMHEKMIEDGVRLGSGHVALSAEGYREQRTLEHFVELDEDVIRTLETTTGVRGWAPRVAAFGLLSKDAATRGVALLGVDPGREPSVTTLAERVEVGDFVSDARPRGMVLGADLALGLGAEIGDELLLYSMAYSLETAYDLFRVVGLMELPDPNLERRLALLSLADAQDFFVYANRVTEVAVLADDADAAPGLSRALGQQLETLEVKTWDRITPELAQIILLDDAGMYIVLVILVVVVGFGILNTILMSVLERQRELGVLLALGLRPGAIFRVIYLESLLLAAIGLVAGLAVGLPLVLYFVSHPQPIGGDVGGAAAMFGIEPLLVLKLKPLNPLGTTITILGVAAVAALYPAVKASQARPVDALRSL